MIAAIIRWSARNVFLIGLATIFVTLAGIYSVSRMPLDAIPDLSDVQVIVYTEYSGQAPQVVEDQVTYPLTTAMLSVPKSRVVRGAQKSLAELRTIQDWYGRYGIAKAEGVAEVASVGGFVKQYSVVIDP